MAILPRAIYRFNANPSKSQPRPSASRSSGAARRLSGGPQPGGASLDGADRRQVELTCADRDSLWGDACPPTSSTACLAGGALWVQADQLHLFLWWPSATQPPPPPTQAGRRGAALRPASTAEPRRLLPQPP